MFSIFRTGLRWVQCNANGQIPPDAILGGRDIDLDLIYVGRSRHNGDVLPAKIIPTSHKLYAFVSYGGNEFLKTSFDVLCGDPSSVSWVQDSKGSVPQRAFVGGITSRGEKLYVGRAKLSTSLTVGKIHPSHGRLYIPFNHGEFCTELYEVLCENTTDSPFQTSCR